MTIKIIQHEQYRRLRDIPLVLAAFNAFKEYLKEIYEVDVMVATPWGSLAEPANDGLLTSVTNHLFKLMNKTVEDETITLEFEKTQNIFNEMLEYYLQELDFYFGENGGFVVDRGAVTFDTKEQRNFSLPFGKSGAEKFLDHYADKWEPLEALEFVQYFDFVSLLYEEATNDRTKE